MRQGAARATRDTPPAEAQVRVSRSRSRAYIFYLDVAECLSHPAAAAARVLQYSLLAANLSLGVSQDRDPEPDGGRKLKAQPSSSSVEMPFSGPLSEQCQCSGARRAGLRLGNDREPGPMRMPASRIHSTGPRRHSLLGLLPLFILWGLPGVHGYCSSSATCPLQ